MAIVIGRWTLGTCMFDSKFSNPSIAVLFTRLRQFAVVGLLWALIGGCDRGKSDSSPLKEPSPRIASLVPAATDLIVAMGAGDHLVAVSDYDQDPRVANLPRVGAYQTIDW